jgi:hypothetical protein
MKSLLLAIAMMTAISCLSQKTTPPTAIQSAFVKKFPGTSVKKWDKEEGKYEANFTKDGKQMSAVFDANGKLEETETVIAVSELPASVVSYVQEHYKGSKIEEAAIVVKSNGEKIYEAEIKGKDLVFDMRGKFLKEEEEKEEAEEKD